MFLQGRPRGERGRDGGTASAAAFVVASTQHGPQRALEVVEREPAIAVGVEDAEDGPRSSSSIAAAAAAAAVEAL